MLLHAQLLQVLLLDLEGGLEVGDLLRQVGIGLGDRVDVLEAVGEIVERRGAQDDLEIRTGTRHERLDRPFVQPLADLVVSGLRRVEASLRVGDLDDDLLELALGLVDAGHGGGQFQLLGVDLGLDRVQLLFGVDGGLVRRLDVAGTRGRAGDGHGDDQRRERDADGQQARADGEGSVRSRHQNLLTVQPTAEPSTG